MRLNWLTILIVFVGVCLFFLLFQKNPYVAIAIVVILIGFKFARKTINPMKRVANELHKLNDHLAYIAAISDQLDRIIDLLTTKQESQPQIEPPEHAHGVSQEVGEMEST